MQGQYLLINLTRSQLTFDNYALPALGQVAVSDLTDRMVEADRQQLISITDLLIGDSFTGADGNFVGIFPTSAQLPRVSVVGSTAKIISSQGIVGGVANVAALVAYGQQGWALVSLLNAALSASPEVSQQPGNTLTSLPDGLFVPEPQARTQNFWIPTPKIDLVSVENTGYNPEKVKLFPTANQNNAIACKKLPMVNSDNVPSSLFDPVHDLRLELLHYHSGGRKNNARSGYHHPIHNMGENDVGKIAPLSGAWVSPTTTGASRSNGYPSVTEWTLVPNQRLMLETLSLWYVQSSVDYRDRDGQKASVNVICPSNIGANSRGIRNRFGYSRVWIKSRFAFRYSVVDPTDNSRRLAGPMTRVIVMHTSIGLFVTDEQTRETSKSIGAACVRVNPAFDFKSPQLYNCWWETGFSQRNA